MTGPQLPSRAQVAAWIGRRSGDILAVGIWCSDVLLDLSRAVLWRVTFMTARRSRQESLKPRRDEREPRPL